MKERVLSTGITNNLLAQKTKINNYEQLKLELNNFQSKEEKLFGNKSFLEIILGLIKNTQKGIIMNEKNKKNKEISNIKRILNVLNNDLLQIKKEKEKEFNLNENIKKEKIKKFFNTNYLNKCAINYVPTNLNTNFDTLITEKSEVESCEELSQLKLLNFKLKNEIKKANNLIKRILIEINYYKTPNKSNGKKTELIYINNNEKAIINQILHNKLIDKRKIFIESASMKNNQDGYINFILDQINKYKTNLKTIYRSREKKNNKNKVYIETIVENTENDNDEISINNDNIYCDSIEFDDLNENIIKEDNDSAEKNNSNKDSTCNEETNCNSCEKNPIVVK